MIQQMLAIWSLVSLPFLHPAWTSGSSRFTYGWSLVCRILSITFASVWDYIFSLSTRWHSYMLGESESRWVVSNSVRPPSTIVHGIFQARILEWLAFPFSRGSSQPRDWTQVSGIAGDSLAAEPQGKLKNTGVGSLSLLQEIFLTWKSKWGLLHCRRILTNWATREAFLNLQRG